MTVNTTGLLAPQVPHVKRLVDSLYTNGFALDMSETGTGKSYAAAAVARELGCDSTRPLVLVCPKTVIPQWTKILASFNLKPYVAINYEKLGRGNTTYMKWKKQKCILKPWVENAVMDAPEFNFPKDALVILDEGHKCKGNHSTNSWMMIMLKEQGYKVLVASATLATTPIELKAAGYLADLHSLYNFDHFLRQHGAEWVGRFGAMSWDAASAAAKHSMMLLNEYFFDTRRCASRLTVDDFGTLFPESHLLPTAFDMGANSSKIQAAYDEMETELARLDDRTEGYSEHIFAIMTKARRTSELCKVPLFCEKIEELFDEGKSVAVFVNFTDSIDAIVSRLKNNKKFAGQIGYIVGGQNANVRQRDIEDFNSDKKRIILCNIAAGGVGISLHDLNGNFPRASVISPTWSAVNLKQVFGRVHRAGALTKCVQYIVYAAGCIEEQICRRVEFKLQNLSTLNDGDLAETVQIM
jgi:hypothetical protein